VIVTGTTRVAAVIGHPIAHTASPALHNAAFRSAGIDAVFVAFDVAPEQLAAAVDGFRASALLGVSVTVPHKRAVASRCDLLAPSAVAAEVVNCLELRPDRRIVGHNTDGAGVLDALATGLDVAAPGIRAVVLGGGGAARGVWVALRSAGAADVAVVVRDPTRVDWCRAAAWQPDALAPLLAAADLLIDCTSSGLSEATEATSPAVPLSVLPSGAAVVSLVYHRWPALLEDAQRRGLRAMDGAGMLVHQAARAFEIWTGRPAPVDAMWQAMRDARSSDPRTLDC
jgi:shikimate dehydrogenase